MTHDTVNCADVCERLRAYAQALDFNGANGRIETIAVQASTLSHSIELLCKQLAADSGGDFLAFRLRQGFAANESDFRQPALERQPLPSAPLGRGGPPAGLATA